MRCFRCLAHVLFVWTVQKNFCHRTTFLLRRSMKGGYISTSILVIFCILQILPHDLIYFMVIVLFCFVNSYQAKVKASPIASTKNYLFEPINAMIFCIGFFLAVAESPAPSTITKLSPNQIQSLMESTRLFLVAQPSALGTRYAKIRADWGWSLAYLVLQEKWGSKTKGKNQHMWPERNQKRTGHWHDIP